MKKCSICGQTEVSYEDISHIEKVEKEGKMVNKIVVTGKKEIHTEMDEIVQDLSERFKFQPGTVITTITYCKENNDFHCNSKAPTHDIFTTETVERLVIKREERLKLRRPRGVRA